MSRADSPSSPEHRTGRWTRRPLSQAASEGVDLDPISVRVSYLHANEASALLELKLGNAPDLQLLSSSQCCSRACDKEAEVKPPEVRRWISLAQGEEAVSLVPQDQEVVVFVQAMRQSEVVGVEPRGPFAVIDNQRNMVESQPIVSF